MIEARWLFNMGIEKVSVLVHPQSIVHSMVEFVDGSILAQLSTPDMCLPIQYALTWPERVQSTRVQTDFSAIGTLTFENPDEERFPALRLAREAGLKGGTLPCVLNAANEIAVESFINSKLRFDQISTLVEDVMSAHRRIDHPTLDQLLEADRWARDNARSRI